MIENFSVQPTKDMRHRKQYVDAGSIIARIAGEKISLLNVEEVVELWSCLIMVIKDCDDYLDSEPDGEVRKKYAEETLEVLFAEKEQKFSNDEFHVVREHIKSLSSVQKRRSKRYGRLLFHATEKVKKGC